MKREITTVRFATHLHLGTGLDLQVSLTNGQPILNVPTTLEFFDDNFLVLKFDGKTKDQKYSQLIPMSQIATIMFKEAK